MPAFMAQDSRERLAADDDELVHRKIMRKTFDSSIDGGNHVEREEEEERGNIPPGAAAVL